MKHCRSVIITIILSVTLEVGVADTSKRAPQQEGVKKVTPQSPTQSTKRGLKKKDTEPWPRTFIPTEKITADSVVSFPADI